MTDIEDLLREELRARAAVADAAAADQPALLAGDLDRRSRRSRLRRRWAASALSAAAVAAVIALLLTLLSREPVITPVAQGGAVPLTDTAATPAGWVSYADGAAQLSVPRDWVAATSPVCGRRFPGYLVLGTASTSLTVRNPRCRQAPNMAAILLHPGAEGRPAGPPTRINGIRVGSVQIVGSPPGSVSYYVPALHVEVTARGPLARRVLATLTRSPLSVVLAHGPGFAVPASWAWHQAGGIRFAAPPRWALVRNGFWPCAMTADSVIIIPARNQQMPRCALHEGLPVAVPGVIVEIGRSVDSREARYDGCRRLGAVRACYSASAYLDGVLHLAVFAPGRQRGTLVEIGLAGSGATARTIFDSIRPR